MKLFIILLVIATFSESRCEFDSYDDIFDSEFEEKWKAYEAVRTPKYFEQRYTHNENDVGVWKQRYFLDDRYNKDNKTVFLIIGGENRLTPLTLEKTQWKNYAKKYGAIVFYVEHRFYGKSHPIANNCDTFNDICFDNNRLKSLGYVSSKLALKDLNYFIVSMTDQYQLMNAKWITFGMSYSGSLAVWMRLFYPDYVHAAVASSAPILAKFNFKESLPITRNSIAHYSLKCVDAIRIALRKLYANLDGKIGKRILVKEFNLCPDIFLKKIDSEDTMFMHSLIYNRISNLVQSNAVNSVTKKSSIQKFCDTLTSDGGTTLSRFRKALGNRETCFSYNYKEFVNKYRNSSWNSDLLSHRSWLFQQCNEFGFFITTENVQDWLGNNFMTPDYFAKLCGDVFGHKFGNVQVLEENVDKTNNYYGGLDIVNRLTNVVFIHGSLDPWHVLGITQSSNPDAPAIFIEGGTHGSDTDPPSVTDSFQLEAARDKIDRLIGTWLSQSI